MLHLGKPFKEDNKGLFYIDSKDVEIKEFNFNEVTNNYRKRRVFYHIEGVDDYVIKDISMFPVYFNEYRNKKMLKNLQINQDKFNDIDFPVAYFIDKKKVVGTVVPYYKGSESLKVLSNVYKLEKLKEFYNHSDGEVSNLIEMCLEVLELIKHMYDENIIYTDINAGNFIVYNNTIKVVDFEPSYVHFKKNKNNYLSLLLSNYNLLVNYIWKHYGFRDMPYNPGNNFREAECMVKSLYKIKRG